MTEFNVENIALEKRNLLEASAGTGKTFSVAILALRLVLEKNLKINEILMVTFTEAATAELSERVGSFIGEAQKACRGQKIDNVVISNLVKKAIEQEGKEVVSERLRTSALLRDELAVFTIHSFCSQVLRQEAFSTGQLFTAEVTSDEEQFLIEGLKDYWRNEVVMLPEHVLEKIRKNLKFKTALDISRKYASRLEFTENEYINHDVLLESLNWEKLDEVVLQQKIDLIPHEIISFFKESKLGKPTHSLTKLADKSKNVVEFMLELSDKINAAKPPKYLDEIDENIKKMVLDTCLLVNNIPEAQIKVVSTIYHRAAKFALEKAKRIKSGAGVQTFNDMIFNLYDILKKGQELAVQERYKAVFIDEFQDTDSFQSFIFDMLFTDEKNALFFVGDPKQSIYGFRGADLDSYQEVKKEVKYSMETNFRSSPDYIAAMNRFFTSQPHFFARQEVQYVKVNANKKDEETANSPALEVYELPAEEKNTAEAVAPIVLDLLYGSHRIGVKENGEVEQKNIRPKDIAVLVRSNSEAELVQKSLMKAGVPSVVLSDKSIFEAEENKVIRQILKAINTKRTEDIKAVLTSSLFTFTPDDIKKIDAGRLYADFSKIITVYDEKGVYAALIALLNEFKISAGLSMNKTTEKDRILSNYKQLAELCNKQERSANASLEDLINWLFRQQQGKEKEGYEQRIESDSEAIHILTIHKSKGLEYNVVVSPSLQLEVRNTKSGDLYAYKQGREHYISLNATKNTQTESRKTADEEENRRLIYVALTRAKYKTVAIVSEKKKKSFFDFCLESLKKDPIKEIVFHQQLPETAKQSTTPDEQYPIKSALTLSKREFKPAFFVSSYSSLSVHAEGVNNKTQEQKPEGEYDKFVFEQMPKGAIFGDFLHKIFEKLHFSKSISQESLEKILSNVSSTLVPKDQLDNYVTFLNHVMNAKLPGAKFTLADINNAEKITELEFYHKVGHYSEKYINAFFDKPIKMKQAGFSGIVKGFIDMVFKLKGKYYIVDWKSNFLGNTLTAYSPQNLEKAMQEHNYHLQYFIYTQALKSYLELIDPDFVFKRDFGGVYYVFLRGCRAGEEYGVYYYR